MSEPHRAAIIALPVDADPSACCVPIAGEPSVVRAVRALHGCVRAGRIVVVAPEASDAVVRDALAAHGCGDVTVITGPRSGGRTGALAAGTEAVLGQGHPSSILVHDVRYPLVPAEVTARVCAKLQGLPVVVPVAPITDSVKSVDERGAAIATVDRTTLLAAQYPRGFAATTLLELGTDDVAVALAKRIPVATVDGHPDGLRFAVPQDVALLEAIIDGRRRLR